MNKVEKKVIGKWDAIVFTNDSETTIMYNGIGGATVSNSIKQRAENSFIKAMFIFDLVKKFI